MSDQNSARKTVRLSAITPANDNTDTGSMDVINDTQTRRTVKLKPLTGAAAAVPAAPAPMAAEPSDDDTSTRKSPVLKPALKPAQIPGMNNPAVASTIKLNPSAPMPAEPSDDEQKEDDGNSDDTGSWGIFY